jgi:putative DNA primase/helicase
MNKQPPAQLTDAQIRQLEESLALEVMREDGCSWEAALAEGHRRARSFLGEQGYDVGDDDGCFPGETYNEAGSRLAYAPSEECDRCRKDEAKRLNVRVGTLDEAVAKAREQLERDTAPKTNGHARPQQSPRLGDAEFDFSHDGLALGLGQRWIDRARYVDLFGRWMLWDGARWRKDTRLQHMTECREYLRTRADDIVRAARSRRIPDFPVEKAEIIAKAVRSAQTVANVASLARSNRELASDVEMWDRDQYLLGTPEGTVDLRSGELRPARLEDYITRVTAVAPAPSGAAAPTWQKFLARITDGSDELQSYLQRFAGYALTGAIQEHAFVFGFGTGANGKSVFVNTLANILNEYSITVPTEMLMISNGDRHPTELARLQGIRLAIGSETEDGRQWAETKIKSLTGGDRIPARYMRQDFFEFDPQFKLFVIGNHKPSLRGVDEAIRRRLHFVPFTVTIPAAERDPELPTKLKAEWPAILTWMIEGCLEWQEKGLAAPDEITKATDAYLTDEDAFTRWRDECTTDDPNDYEKTGDLWASFKRWAELAGEYVGKQRRFSERLEGAGLTADREGKNRDRVYRGISLKPVANYTSDPRLGERDDDDPGYGY